MSDAHYIGECVSKQVTAVGIVVYETQVCDLPPDIDPTPVEARLEDNEESISEEIDDALEVLSGSEDD